MDGASVQANPDSWRAGCPDGAKRLCEGKCNQTQTNTNSSQPTTKLCDPNLPSTTVGSCHQNSSNGKWYKCLDSGWSSQYDSQAICLGQSQASTQTGGSSTTTTNTNSKKLCDPNLPNIGVGDCAQNKDNNKWYKCQDTGWSSPFDSEPLCKGQSGTITLSSGTSGATSGCKCDDVYNGQTACNGNTLYTCTCATSGWWNGGVSCGSQSCIGPRGSAYCSSSPAGASSSTSVNTNTNNCSVNKTRVDGVTCDAACCRYDSDCPTGQTCTISNGACKFGKSCDANPPPKTVVKTVTTVTLTPTVNPKNCKCIYKDISNIEYELENGTSRCDEHIRGVVVSCNCTKDLEDASVESCYDDSHEGFCTGDGQRAICLRSATLIGINGCDKGLINAYCNSIREKVDYSFCVDQTTKHYCKSTPSTPTPTPTVRLQESTKLQVSKNTGCCDPKNSSWCSNTYGKSGLACSLGESKCETGFKCNYVSPAGKLEAGKVTNCCYGSGSNECQKWYGNNYTCEGHDNNCASGFACVERTLAPGPGNVIQNSTNNSNDNSSTTNNNSASTLYTCNNNSTCESSRGENVSNCPFDCTVTNNDQTETTQNQTNNDNVTEIENNPGGISSVINTITSLLGSMVGFITNFQL